MELFFVSSVIFLSFATFHGNTRRRGCSAAFAMFDKRGFSNKQDFLSRLRTLLLEVKAVSETLKNYRMSHLQLLKRTANKIDNAVLKSNNLDTNVFFTIFEFFETLSVSINFNKKDV